MRVRLRRQANKTDARRRRRRVKTGEGRGEEKGEPSITGRRVFARSRQLTLPLLREKLLSSIGLSIPRTPDLSFFRGGKKTGRSSKFHVALILPFFFFFFTGRKILSARSKVIPRWREGGFRRAAPRQSGTILVDVDSRVVL